MAGTSALVLQARDRQLFRALATMRVIDREQAKIAAGFRSTTRANTRLLALTRQGLLSRHVVGTAAGGHKYLYALTRRSAHLMDTQYRGAPWTSATSLAGSIGLEHQLRLNDLYLLLVHHRPQLAGVTVEGWRTFAHPVATSVPLIPDAYVELQTQEMTRPYFLELDRGTETRRTWTTKAQQYVRLATSGGFHALFGHPQFGVLVVAPSRRRVDSLRATIARLTNKLFWFGTYDVLSPSTFWSASWSRPTNSPLQPLIPSP
jgi:hypothetical protein